MTFWKWSSTAASNSTADSTINWAEGQAPSSVNDSARAMMAAAAKYRLDMAGVTTGGTSTAYTLTSNQVFDTLAHLDGNVLCIIPHTTNGASPTLAVDGLTARAINKSTGVAVGTGSLVATNSYFVRYVNASTEFILVDKYAVLGSDITSGKVGLANGGTNADLSATGGTSQVLQQASSGAAITVGQLAATNLSDTITGSGNLVKATSPTLTTPVLGVASYTSLAGGAVASTGAVTSSSPSAGIGYATGAGSTVAQATSENTAVTINAICGQITMVSHSESTGNSFAFTVNNSAVAANDTVVACIKSTTGNVGDRILLCVTAVAAGSFQLHGYCTSTYSSVTPVINFAVIKAVTS